MMKILPYYPEDCEDICRLWNRAGVRDGYAPLTNDELETLIFLNPYFSPEHTFLLMDEEKVAGFVCGVVSDQLPRGAERGYFTCLLLDENANTQENTELLMDRLEDSFRAAGRTKAVSNFFNPIRLPWIIPGTDGCQHNNAPGIPTDSFLYERMKERGYRELERECALYLDLKDFSVPEQTEALKEKAALEHYRVDWYDARCHKGLTEMVASTGNPQWMEEIPRAAAEINMLVALHDVEECSCIEKDASSLADAEVVGFTGPVYPEKTGRGYFAGVAVSSKHERHGLGTLLFYRLCEEEKKKGAAYMSLFTGKSNHAKKIYLGAGCEVRREFAVMEKTL